MANADYVEADFQVGEVDEAFLASLDSIDFGAPFSDSDFR